MNSLFWAEVHPPFALRHQIWSLQLPIVETYTSDCMQLYPCWTILLMNLFDVQIPTVFKLRLGKSEIGLKAGF